MVRTLSILTALAVSSAAHGDEVVDVRLLASGEHIWIALDQQPEALRYQTSNGRISVQLDGFQPADTRTIQPSVTGLITAMGVRPASAGSEIEIVGSFARGHAELREGGILIDMFEAAYRVAATDAMPGHQDVSRPQSGSGSEGVAERGDDGVSDRPSYSESSGTAQASATRAQHDADQVSGPRQTAEAAASPPTPSGRDSGGFVIGDPIDESTPAGGLWLMESDEPEPQAPAAQPASPMQADTPAPVETTEPAAEPEGDGAVDLSSIPGETELVVADADQPGPCDPTAAAIASSPWDLDALANHAACLIEIGEYQNGAGLYERVLAFDPGHFQAALGLARLRERQGRRDDAARLFETAADAALTDGQALSARAAARRLRNND